MTGAQLRAWMERHHYTAASLGLALGVAERTIYRWRTSPAVPGYVALALEALEHRRAEQVRAQLEREAASAGANPPVEIEYPRRRAG